MTDKTPLHNKPIKSCFLNVFLSEKAEEDKIAEDRWKEEQRRKDEEREKKEQEARERELRELEQLQAHKQVCS